MITPADDGPDFDSDVHAGFDDPIAVILRPPAEYLGPPPGRYEAIRRGAARRKLLRAAAGAGLVCAVAALVVLPLRQADSGGPAAPTVPLAPPPASVPASTPASSPPSDSAVPSEPAGTPMPSPSAVPSGSVPTLAPSALGTAP
ncbi:hypothetical protein ACIGMX_37940 [Streptomyces aquilus]|uniref:Uncharacterized protein n=1 Tax=Streptomyces aquilus TaxID=2548456 RepID=A0A3Q9C4V9_9ACTN|nr:hypothetical protein [Streptomyces aquilus]AZP20728.1 hypothetical protein EJC51_34450 [Streptomyces aquilus]